MGFPDTKMPRKGEWLILSHSVAKRLLFANGIGKKHLAAVHAAGLD